MLRCTRNRLAEFTPKVTLVSYRAVTVGFPDLRDIIMELLRPLIALVIGFALSACVVQPPAPAKPAQPPADAPQSLPDAFTVSTNEPFWSAKVQGATVVLTGPDQVRTFAVESNEAVMDGRVVTARDAAGTLELRITERLCMDSMSGDSFVYTARLSLDDQAPVEGCGKPSK